MPLLNESVHHLDYNHNPHEQHQHQIQPGEQPHQQLRKGSQTQISDLARSAIMGSMSAHAHTARDSSPASSPILPPTIDNVHNVDGSMEQLKVVGKPAPFPPDKPSSIRRRQTEERVNFAHDVRDGAKPRPAPCGRGHSNGDIVVGSPTGALNDTPATSAPGSPSILPKIPNSNEKIRVKHPTTLDIPGLTKSAISPDGRIAQRDLGAKLVIVMVGLPARGKSYITKKMARYLNWLQHDTRIFNVGERRRVAAGGSNSQRPSSAHGRGSSAGSAREMFRQQYLSNGGTLGPMDQMDAPTVAAHMLLKGGSAIENSPEGKPTIAPNFPSVPELVLPEAGQIDGIGEDGEEQDSIDQSAGFFDPSNTKAAILREKVALESLDELLDYILNGNGAVGILDATNSTVERRKLVME